MTPDEIKKLIKQTVEDHVKDLRVQDRIGAEINQAIDEGFRKHASHSGTVQKRRKESGEQTRD